MTFNAQTAALIGAVTTAILGALAYRRSLKVDKIAEQAGIATVAHGSIQQIIDGLNSLVAALQADNTESRRRVDALEGKMTTLEAIEEECRHQLAVITADLRALRAAPE